MVGFEFHNLSDISFVYRLLSAKAATAFSTS